MDKNKSIDGLVTRRTKKSATPTSTTKKSPRKPSTKSSVKPVAKSVAKPATKSAVKVSTKQPSKSTTKLTSRPVAKPTTKRTKKTTTPKSTRTKKSIDISTAPLQPIQDVLESSPTSNPDNTPQAELTSPHTEPLTSTSAAADFLKPVQAFDFDEQSGELKASDTPIDHQSNKKPKKEKKKMSKKLKITLWIISVILLLIIGAGICFIIWGNDIIAKITGGQGSIFDLITFNEPTYEPLRTDANGRTNILAFGTSGYNMEGDEGEGIHDGAQLTDSIMVISLNQDTGDVAMLSLPRDLKASPTCTATGKINEVYWCNNMEGDNEQAGAEALMTEVGDILDIDFQYYAHLNWGSLVQIVDTLGGINVVLDEDIEDYYYTGAVFEAGQEYTIDGEQALGLARARHGTTGGDFSRGASQQKILIGIKNKVFEKQLSLTDLIGLANTLGDNLRTNFNVEELKSIAHLASEFDFDTMRQVSLIEPEMLMTTGEINGISYVLPYGGANYYTRIRDYVAKMFSNNPSTYEDATILVLNGTETPYLASNEQTSLEKEGYTNITAENAPEGTYEGEYTLYALGDSAPGTKKMLETKYNQTAKSYDTLPTDISHDYDFVLILGITSTQE